MVLINQVEVTRLDSSHINKKPIYINKYLPEDFCKYVINFYYLKSSRLNLINF